MLLMSVQSSLSSVLPEVQPKNMPRKTRFRVLKAEKTSEKQTKIEKISEKTLFLRNNIQICFEKPLTKRG